MSWGSTSLPLPERASQPQFGLLWPDPTGKPTDDAPNDQTPSGPRLKPGARSDERGGLVGASGS